jgi:hypothetical protein
MFFNRNNEKTVDMCNTKLRRERARKGAIPDEGGSNQQGILEVNHVMTWSGALTSSTAASSSSVTHRQHGQMHEIGSLHQRITSDQTNRNRVVQNFGEGGVACVPDDPDDGADDGDKDGEEREGQAEQEPERPAPAVVVAVAAAATAAHLRSAWVRRRVRSVMAAVARRSG